MPRIIGAVQFTNSEPMESKAWGRWIPQERFEAQIAELLASGEAKRLDPKLGIFFSREQRIWTVRGCLVGGPVEGPMIRFPVYFQCEELWEFEGCRVKVYFDPYAETVTGTIVLEENEWRGLKRGHVIAREVAALELPPQAVLATEGWDDDGKRAKNLAIRKAIAKAVRTESWSWMGKRVSEARDGMGNVSKAEIRGSKSERSPNTEVRIETATAGTRSTIPAAVATEQRRSSSAAGGLQGVLGGMVKAPSAEDVRRRRERLAASAEAARELSTHYNERE